jgi:hypothetical protein
MKSGVVIAIVLLGFYVWGVMPTGNDKVVTTPDVVTTVRPTIPTTVSVPQVTPIATSPRVYIPVQPITPVEEDPDQEDCQLELGENYCDENDLEEYQYGREW